jgi:uncharacterized Zn finger protein
VLSTVLTREKLRRLAGVLSFKRGREYLSDGAVSAVLETEGKVEARVRGTRTYRVRFWMEKKDLGWFCDCPHADEGNFCKHCVAAGLAWLAPRIRGNRSRTEEPAVDLEDVRTYLSGASKNELVGLLMEQALESDRLRRRLLRKAAENRPGGPDAETIRASLRNAIRLEEFVDYESAHEHGDEVMESIKSIGGVLALGNAKLAMELSEYAAQLIDQNVEMIDQSGGDISLIQSQLHEIHHKACSRIKFAPVDLAKRLRNLETSGEFGMIGKIPTDYGDLLGKLGMAAYRKLSKKSGRRTS